MTARSVGRRDPRHAQLSDHPTTLDQLGFEPYARALEDRITHSAGQLTTLGVYGPWGSGKTSLLQMVAERLQDQGVQVIWFNAWKYQAEDELWAALIQSILNQARLQRSPLKRARLRWRLWWQRLNWGSGGRDALKKLLPAVGKMALPAGGVGLLFSRGWLSNLADGWMSDRAAGVLGQVLAVGGGAALTLTGVIATRFWEWFSENLDLNLEDYQTSPAYKDHIAFLDRFSEELEQVIDAVTAPGLGDLGQDVRQPLVVMIDDLDRAAPDKVVAVLEAIKLFITDTTNAVFVIAADKDYVERAIRAEYKDLKEQDPAGYEAFGRNYLEKIVQLPFNLPPLEQGNIARFIDEMYSDPEIKRHIRLFQIGLEPNPRQVKRVLQVFKFMMALVRRQLPRTRSKRASRLPTTGYDFSLLAKMVLIQYRWPDIYEAIVHDPEVLVIFEEFFRVPDRQDYLSFFDPDSATVALLNRHGGDRALERMLTDPQFGTFIGAPTFPYIYLTQIGTAQTAPILPISPSGVQLPRFDHLTLTIAGDPAGPALLYSWEGVVNNNQLAIPERTWPGHQAALQPPTTILTPPGEESAGVRLYREVFRPVDKQIKPSTERRFPIRVQLNVADNPPLAYVRWEEARPPESDLPLGARSDVLFMRYYPRSGKSPFILRTGLPVKVLVVVARPADIETVSEFETIRTWFPAAFGLMLNRRDAQIDWVIRDPEADPAEPQDTASALSVALEKGYDVVHFYGLGGYQLRPELGPPEPDYFLFAEDQYGDAIPLRVTQLAGILNHLRTRRRMPRLVVVDAPDSGERGESGTSFAELLLKEADLPAVVGMAGEIGAAASRGFVSVFYDTLIRQGQVDLALAAARNAVYQSAMADYRRLLRKQPPPTARKMLPAEPEPPRDYLVPRLFSQVADGAIFRRG